MSTADRASQALTSPAVAYLSQSLLLQSPISHGRFSHSRLSLTVASPAVPYLSRSLLPQSPISHGRFSHSHLSLTVASPAAPYLSWSPISHGRFTRSHVSCGCFSHSLPVSRGRFSHVAFFVLSSLPLLSSISCSHISCSLISLQSHFLQSYLSAVTFPAVSHCRLELGMSCSSAGWTAGQFTLSIHYNILIQDNSHNTQI